jgi:hypothetical protein
MVMKQLVLAALASICLPSVACAQQATQGGVPALYATKAEAEKAASQFHCTGAHQMGDKWMPCTKHGEAQSHAH